MGDHRSTNDELPAAVPVFTSVIMTYAKDAPTVNMQTFVPEFVVGLTILNSSYTIMATQLGLQIMEQARAGLYPTSIEFPGATQKICKDINLGRHKITVSCKGRFRFQNVTPAGAGGATDSTNINAIDANPVNGKIYTFRNQAPLFSSSYVDAFGTTVPEMATMTAIKELQSVRVPFEMYGDVGAGGKGGGAFLHIAAPPLNPSSIWRNVSSTGVVTFPPGGFKTFTTSYLRQETIARYCQSITQADESIGLILASNHANYPPAGDSFMMCLRPTVKTVLGEPIKMAYNTEYVYTASIQKRKVSPLQVVNDIE